MELHKQSRRHFFRSVLAGLFGWPVASSGLALTKQDPKPAPTPYRFYAPWRIVTISEYDANGNLVHRTETQRRAENPSFAYDGRKRICTITH